MKFERRHLRRRRTGLGLFELLVSLAIVAALLTATGVAFDASIKAYQINEEQSTLLQRARVAMNRMTTGLRTGNSHVPHTSTSATQFATGATVTDTGVDLYDPAGKFISYRYDSAKQQVLCVTGSTTNVLARGVTAFTIKLEPMRSANAIKTGGGWDLLRRGTILMSIRTTSSTAAAGESTGTQTVTLSASVMPRRNAF